MYALLDRLYAVRVPDHRGQRVGLAWVDGMANFRRSKHRLPPAVFRAARKHVLPSHKWSTWILTGALVFWHLTLSGEIVELSRRMNLSLSYMVGALFFAQFLGLFAFTYVVLLPISRRLYARDLIATCVSHGACASCGYDLREVHPSPDGCAVCPECGAAWRLASTIPSHGNGL